MSEVRSAGVLPHAESTPPNMKKIAVASVIGTTVEWYDLFVFATASALVFNKVFFPGFVPLIGTLLAFGTFASAYLARIVGAALFGHFGDRLGRKSMLLVSLITMGIATFAIGLLAELFERSASGRRFCCSRCASFRASRSAANGAAPC